MSERERERERTTKRIRPRGRAEKENDARPPSRETDGLFFVAPPLLLETRITTLRSPARARALSQKVSLVFDGALREREKKKREKINARILFLRVLRRRRRRRTRRRRLPRFCRGLSAFSSSSSSSSFSAAAKAPAFSRRRCHYDDDDLRLSSFNSTTHGG